MAEDINDSEFNKFITVNGVRAVRTILVDTNGDQIASFGGGTQYTEGSTDATITGTALMWEDAGNTLVPVSSAKPLPVDATVNASIDTTGLATDTNQTTIIGHVDGIETLIGTTNTTLSTIDADTSNISTKIDTIAGAVATEGSALGSGVLLQGDDGTDRTNVLVDTTGHLQVDVLSMPAGGSGLTDAELRATPVVVDLGANNDVTVTSGTITANLSATDNAVLDQLELNQDAQTALLTTIDGDTGNLPTIETNTDFGTVVGGGTETGALRVTIANNSTGVVSIDDNGGAITVDGTVAVTNADITSIKTAVEILDNAISGSEMQVDVVGALPAGTNAIGKLAANSGVDIGDVDVTSIPALVAGTAEIGSLLPPDTDVTAHTNYARKYYTSTGAATDGIIWSPAAGKRWHVVTMYIQTSADATITLEDDKAGGDDPVWKGEISAKSGVTLSFTEQYPMASGEDAADLTITTTAGNVYCTVVGYEV